MSRPIGGRGYKGVGTTHIRVPLPVEEKVRKIVVPYYEGETDPKPVNELPTLEKAISMAESLLSAKKSARTSMAKLLEQMYGQKVELNLMDLLR